MVGILVRTRVREQLTLLTGLWGGRSWSSFSEDHATFICRRPRNGELSSYIMLQGSSTLRGDILKWVPGGGLWGCQKARSRDQWTDRRILIGLHRRVCACTNHNGYPVVACGAARGPHSERRRMVTETRAPPENYQICIVPSTMMH